MKKFIILVMILICSTGVYGQIIKSQYDSVGIGDIKTVDDGYAKKVSPLFMYGESGGYEMDPEPIIDRISEVEECSNIIVVKPKNILKQLKSQSIQYGTVKKVIKSDYLQEGDDVTMIIPFGIVINDSGKMEYWGTSGYLDYKYEYLVFAEDAILNDYISEKVIYPFDDTTYCFRLSSEESNELYKDGMTLDEMRDFEFYSKSEEFLEQMYELKHKIIKKYLGN